MEGNRDLVAGRSLTAQGKQDLERAWDSLTFDLNSVALGDTKCKAKWRMYWNELKYSVRSKATRLRTQCSGTGGGPSHTMPFTAFEERVYALIGGETAVFGIEALRIPFDLELTATTPSPVLQLRPPSPILQQSHPPPVPENQVVSQPNIPGTSVVDAENSQHTRQRRESNSQSALRWAIDLEEKRINVKQTLVTKVTSIYQSLKQMVKEFRILNIIIGRALGVRDSEV